MSVVRSISLKRALVAASLLGLSLSPSLASAQTTEQDHVVSTQALQQQVDASTTERQKNIETLNNLISSPEAQEAVHEAHTNVNQLRAAIPTLSDQELKDLATRANDAQQNFAAGHIGPSLLTLIVLGIIVIIIVAIVA